MAGNDHAGRTDNHLTAGTVHGRVVLAGSVGTINHTTVQAAEPAPPPDHYADVFAALAQVRFTPRRWLTDKLDAFFEQADHGYFFIDGKAGVGKTTFAAWAAQDQDWPRHFTGGDPRRRLAVTARRSLADQLEERFGPLPGSAATPAAFAELLVAAGEAAAARDDLAVLVIDGLDQAEPVRGCMPLGLPDRLPRNVYVIATLRAGTEVFGRVDRTGKATIDPTTAAADLREHAAAVPLDPDLRERIVQHCAGDFLLLRYLLARPPGPGEPMPDGAWSFYSRWLRDLAQDDPAGALAVPVLSTLACVHEPIGLDTLCALSGVDDARAVKRLALTSLQHLVLVIDKGMDVRLSIWHDTVRDYFTGQAPQDFHSGDHYQYRVLAEAAETAAARVIDRYRTAPPDLDGGYGARHLVAHLDAAGRHDDLHALLNAEVVDETGRPVNAWFRARAGAPDGYRADLAIARRAAERAVDADLAERRQARIGLELRYALMDASVEAVSAMGAAPLAPAFVRGLVARRMWSPSHALRQFSAVDDAARTVALVTAVLDGADHLTAEEAGMAWDMVFPPRAYGGFRLAARLLPMLAADVRDRICGELHRLASAEGAVLPARLLGVMAGCQDADALLDAVWAMGDEERSTAGAVENLLPHLSRAALIRAHDRITSHSPYRNGWAVAHRALALRHAQDGTNPDWLADHVAAELAALAGDGTGLVVDEEPPLCLLLAALDPVRRDLALARVLDRVAEQPPWGVAQRLAHVGRYLTGPALDRALRMARRIPVRGAPGARALALAALLPALDAGERTAVVKEVLAAPDDRDAHKRGTTLALAAEHTAGREAAVERAIRGLSAADRPVPLAALARHHRPELLTEALDLVAELGEPRRAATLVAMAPHLDRHTRDHALALAEDTENALHRVQAIDAIAGAAAEDDLTHALRAARTVADRRGQARALAALAHHADSGDVPRLRAGVEARVPVDSDPVVLLASVLPPDQRTALLRRVADALPVRRPLFDRGYLDRLAAVRRVLTGKEALARLIEAAHWRPRPGWEGLDVWTVLDPAPELVAAARKAVRKRLNGAHEFAQWTAMLAPHLAVSELDDHLADTARLPDVVRHLPLAALARRLDPARRDRAIRESLAIMCAEDRPHPRGPASVPVGLDPHSVALLVDAAPDPAPVLDAVLPRIHTTRDAWRLFALVLPRLSDVDRERVERAAAEHLATRLPDPRNHQAAIAAHTGDTFHRALLDAHRHARDDVKADARAAVLAATRAADWTGVRDLLAGLARPGLLTALAAAAPAIGALGGNRAARECADAIEDVARWWP